MSRKLLFAVLSLLVTSAVTWGPAGAVAQKGVLGTGGDPFAGVADPDGGFRYTALPTDDGTVLSKIEMGTGEIEQFRQLGARLVVPAVAYDFSPGGLSADGETWVLAEPGERFPQQRSEFTIIDTRTFRTVEQLSFDGTFSFDALSPDGRSLFLIEYKSPRNLTEYVVREYDLARDRFNPRPIIDPNESAEEMYGSPVARATSPDGRWEYTLYDGREHPFIHALDTERAVAVCIDLETFHRPVYGATELELSAGGSALTVIHRGNPTEVVDTRTFEAAPATEPAGADPTPAASADDGDSGLIGWAVLAGGLVLLAGAVGMLARRHWNAPTGEAELERLAGIEPENGGGAAQKERERDPVA